MKVGDLRERHAAAMAGAMRRREPEAVALAGMDPSDEVDPEALVVGTREAAIILGFHPEHVRRLIRTGRLRAALVRGDYQVQLSDLWPLLEVRYRSPGKRRLTRQR